MIGYPQWRSILGNERLPAVIIDLDAFDRNVEKTTRMVKEHGKTLRLATKSLRVPDLIARALKLSGGVFQGLMCFSAEEAAFLHTQGFDDLMVAYPTLQASDLGTLRSLHGAGARITIVVDHTEQVRALAASMQGVSKPFAVLLDVDMSLRLLGGLIHIGVRRSRIRSMADAAALCEEISRHPELQIIGLMAYEAQVAGLGDRNPFKKMLNPIFGLIRNASIKRVAKLRAEITRMLHDRGYPVSLINGGGTGSLNFALEEGALTEVTIGSGLFCSHLFDYYSNIQFEPSFFFALQAVRTSDSNYVTCQGGGYIASGEPGWDRVPVPYLPEGIQLVPTEGCGEVQTPVKLPSGMTIPLGAPVFFRHAKAGELAERFNEYLLVSKSTIVGRAKTYRGMGQCFF